MTEKYHIHILPHGRRIKTESGKNLLKVLVDHSVYLRSECGGRGTCGKCKVRTIEADGSVESVKSCTFEVTEDLQIEIPESSMLSSHVVSKAPAAFPASFLNRKYNRDVSDTYGIAVDLGTTTIAVYLCIVNAGKVLSSIALKNPQALYGDDVMSRIGAIDLEETTLPHLQKLVVRAIEWGIQELLEAHNISQDKLSRIVTVGNPTMIHILTGVDPKPIGTFPYQPSFYEAKNLRAADAGFKLSHISLQTLPQVSGFIGGDILSAALAVDLENQPEGTLLIDLGTNGELLLKGKDRLFATSCATGPAFEGASLSCGMQAIPGAVNKVIIDGDDFPTCTIINPHKSSQVKPCGICGTGAISGVAEFYRNNIIDQGGAFIKEANIKPLIKDAEGKPYFILVPKESAEGGASLHISQKDIRSVQLGKAALFTGIEFLLHAAGYEKPEKIIIAGAFGTYIETEDMFTLGMIPTIDSSKVEIAGNSAGAGAVMVLCDDIYLEKSINLANTITIIDLACDMNFQEVFVQRLGFPLLKKYKPLQT